MIWLQIAWAITKIPYQVWRTCRAYRLRQRAQEDLADSAARLALAEERLQRAKAHTVKWTARGGT